MFQKVRAAKACTPKPFSLQNSLSFSALKVAPGLLVLLLSAAPSLWAQSASMIGGSSVQRMEQERKALAAVERQKKMASDADKLVQLAQQLKVSVDKTNKDVLSIDVIREAERIEKLAREVREGMRQ